MRNLLTLLLAVTLLTSCNNDKKAEDKEAKPVDPAPATEIKKTVVDPLETLLGSFVGLFGDKKITLLITKIKGDTVGGRSIVAGNNRPFTGTLKKEGYKYLFTAKEPGDHPNDGEFNFEIDESHPDLVNGSWKPNDTKKPVKEYTLQRKKFEYRPDVGNYPEASTRLLKPEDVENLVKQDLEFMRNEIFARHGYCFNKKHLRQQFEMNDWYVPNTVDIKGFLTDIEKKNIALIKRYEQYAEDYGDEYGR